MSFLANFVMVMFPFLFTGRFHAGIVTNNESWEAACLKAGRVSGDLVHAMPYTPELHFGEFSSALADMKNSVAVSFFVLFLILL